MSPKQISECWEAFSLNRNLNELDDHSFPSFRLALIKDSDNAELLLQESASNSGAVISRPSNKRQTLDDDGLPTVTPPAKRFNASLNKASAVDAVAASDSTSRRVSLSPAPPGSLSSADKSNLPKYSERQGAGKMLVTFNPNKLEASANASMTSRSTRCNISYSFPSNVQKPYRHMFTTIDERAKALDKQMVDLGDAMIERYGLGKEEEEGSSETAIAGLEAVGVPRQDKVCCIGRVCNAVSLSVGFYSGRYARFHSFPRHLGPSQHQHFVSYIQGPRGSHQCHFCSLRRFEAYVRRGAH